MPKIYYNRQAVGDVLLIIYDDATIPNKIINNDNVTALYKDGVLIGVNIFDFSKIARIFHNGEIIEPTSEFVKIINHILINANIKPLEE